MISITWENVSAIDRTKALVVINPSGVDYTTMKPSDMLWWTLKQESVRWATSTVFRCKYTFRTVSSFSIYRWYFPYSRNKFFSFAQAGKPIRALGSTHANYLYGDIPFTKELTYEDTAYDYEANTGKVIVEAIHTLLHRENISGVFVKNHGPFT